MRSSEEPCRDVQWAVDRDGTKSQYDSPPPGPSRFLAIYFGGCSENPTWAVIVLSVADEFNNLCFSLSQESYSLLGECLGSCGATVQPPRTGGTN